MERLFEMLQNWKKILMLAIPSLLSFATATVIGTVNLIMVGHLGALIIAIVGVSNIIMYNGFAIFSGIGHTVNYLVAQNYGANDMRTGVKRMYYALYLCTFFAIVLLIMGWLFSGVILGWTGGSSELVSEGESYLQLRFVALAIGMISFVFHGFLRGIGDTKTSMVLSVISNVIILFLVYALVFGHFGLPELGLEGSGLAILIGEAIGFLLAIYVYFFRLHPLYNTRTWVMPRFKDMGEMISESTKLGVQEFSMSLSMFIFTVFVARLGTEALAANEVALNVMSFGFMPAFAFGATATILVGQEVGRGQPLRGRRAGTDTAIMGSIFLLVLGTVEFIFAENISKLYNNTDPGVFHTAAQLIMISAFLQLFDGFLNFYAGGLRGIGDTTFLLRASLVVAWCLFVPLSYLLIFVLDMGSIGAWIALYTYLMVFGLTLMYRFYRKDWSTIQVKGGVHA